MASNLRPSTYGDECVLMRNHYRDLWLAYRGTENPDPEYLAKCFERFAAAEKDYQQYLKFLQRKGGAWTR